MQLTQVGDDQDAERVLIARPGPGQQRLLALAMRAAGHDRSLQPVTGPGAGL
jgi:hypothetical protein